MANNFGIGVESPLGKRLHLIDASARRVHLPPLQDVGRTRLEAETAVNAIEKRLVVNHVTHGPAPWL